MLAAEGFMGVGQGESEEMLSGFRYRYTVLYQITHKMG
jgi:hypothetical protein